MVITCTPVSPGYVAGRVEIIDRIEDTSDHGFGGSILVMRHLRPDIVVLVGKKALGIVAESGGIICHGAIIARELGLPCVVLKDARILLKQGDTIRLNASKGSIEVI